MKPIFKSGLVKDVIISYICMIVFPVMIILSIAFVIAGRYIYRAATDSVRVTQNAILEQYQEERRSTALVLARVVNMSNGTTVAELSEADENHRQEAMEQLDTMYQMLASPEYKILDIHLYRKDGTAITPKVESRYSLEALRHKNWYQAALSRPGLVYTAMEAEDYFYRIRSSQEALVIAAYAPKNLPAAECIVLYRISKIPNTIKYYNKSGRYGDTCLVDMKGQAVADPDRKTGIPDAIKEQLPDFGQEEHQITSGGIRYMVTPVPDSGYFLVSAVNQSSLFRQFSLFSAISMIVILCVILMFIFYFRRYMNRLLLPLHHLTEGMKQVEQHNLDTQVEMCHQQDIARMISIFNNMVNQIKRLIHDKEVAEKEKYQEELHTLQSQMNPHFLMNTLNTLKFMAISAHFTGMQDMVTALENILAAVLNRDGGFYTVKDEQSVLESYIYIMRFRYIDSFEVDMEISDHALSCKVPKLILQPIVENCITHGFSGIDEGLGRITVTGEIRDGKLVFEITDNGIGMNQATIQRILGNDNNTKPENEDSEKRRTIGVRNTDRRLKLNFGPEYGVSIHSEPGSYSRVTLTMPVITNTMGENSNAYCVDS